MGKDSNKRMRTASAGGDYYYYAGGQRVQLIPADDLLAIDDQSFAVADLPQAVRAAVERLARPLTSGVRLLERAALGDDPDVIRAMQQAHVLQPVFRSQGAVVVVLPEVRVEEGRGGAKQQRLERWLTEHARHTLIESQSDGRITVRPTSGYGGDALSIANALAEDVKPEMAQARFVRIVPRPSPIPRQ